MNFIDEARILVWSGDGGDGCVSFRREKYVPRGGPDGGDGGDGGDVVLKVDGSLTTLLDLRYRREYRAGHGRRGRGKRMTGRRGEDVAIRVPSGTIVRDAGTGAVLADLTEENALVVVLNGGRGGRGNTRFASATDQAPRRFGRGREGAEMMLDLELKLIADVGLVGFPNAGKSTLLARVSAAHPKIADYPFTTLEPHLGIVRVGEFDTFVMADLPGLIEGAHEGKGLGYQFLRHIERTRLLLYMIECTSEDPARDLNLLKEELRLFSPDLVEKPSLITLTKIDLLPSESPPDMGDERTYIPISAHTGRGLSDLVFALGRALGKTDNRDAETR